MCKELDFHGKHDELVIMGTVLVIKLNWIRGLKGLKTVLHLLLDSDSAHHLTF